MSCGCNSGDCDEPIPEAGQVFQLTETPQTLADLGFNVSDDVCQLQISILDSKWSLKPIVRWSKDPSATITATQGRLIFPFSKICLNEFETDSVFRAVSGTVDIYVQEFLQPVDCDFQIPYLGVLQKLMPQGFAWEAKTIPDSNLYKLLNTAAKLASDLHCRTLALVNEFYPSTSRELQSNWINESFSSSLDDCLRGLSLNVREQIVTILAKMQGAGGYRVEDFEAIGEIMGLDVQISDDPSTFTMTFDIIGADIQAQALCNMTACSRITDGPDMNFILAFRCLMNKVAPAQSDKVFLLDGGC